MKENSLLRIIVLILIIWMFVLSVFIIVETHYVLRMNKLDIQMDRVRINIHEEFSNKVNTLEIELEELKKEQDSAGEGK